MAVDRSQFVDACKSDDFPLVSSILADFLQENKTTSAGEFAARHIQDFAVRNEWNPVKVGFLTSFTLEPMNAALTLSEFNQGRSVNSSYWPYGQWQQELMIGSGLDGFAPNAVFILLHLDDILPKLARQHIASENLLDAEVASFLGSFETGIKEFRKRSQTPIFIANFISMSRGFERCFDRNVEKGRQARIDHLNQGLTRIVIQHTACFVFDYAGLVADHGRNNWFDIARHYHIGASIQGKMLPNLAAEISRYLSALLNPRKKVLAVDLDNTLWNGILGEDGLDGIAFDGPYPGNAHADFQAMLLNLRASGINLAILSKNTISDVTDVFEADNGMTLSWDDFASHQVNWDDKFENIKIAAQDINLGLNSFVFVDDSSVELDLMREMEPEVEIAEFGGIATRLPQLLCDIGGFDALSLTDDDLNRSRSYQAEKLRKVSSEKSVTKDDFLASLNLTVSFKKLNEQTLRRVSQLFGKVNQFNFTTKRYSESDLAAFQDVGGYVIFTTSLQDIYGAYGMIGAVVLKISGDECHIDSFLMSCRALGRNVEDAILSHIETIAKAHGAVRLIGEYRQTPKNKFIENFYSERSFQKISSKKGFFEFDMEHHDHPDQLKYITVVNEDE